MIVAVAGLPGSGKSFFAQRLAEQLDAVYLSSDHVRKASNALGRYSSADKQAVYDRMLALSEAALAQKKTVVADATFYRKAIRRQFARLAQKWQVPVRFILVYADDSLIRERLSRQRPDSEANYSVHLKIKEQFEPVKAPCLELRSSNDNIDMMISQALHYVYHPNDR